MALFTPEELAELAAADAELDESFYLTQEERVESRKRDRAARLANMDKRQRKIAESQRAYREANREEYNAYMREYRRKRREKQKEATA